jgi:hypothetical protein
VGLMTANFLAEIRREGREIYPVADVYWNDNTMGYYSSSPVLHYNPIVVESGWSDIRQAIAIRPPGSLERLTADLRVDDSDRTITRMLQGSTNMRRSRVLWRWACPTLDVADWFTLFDGILQDWAYDRTTIVLRSRTDDQALEGYIPKVPIIKGSFPGAPATSLGVYLPIVYGIHDSASLSGTGMVPAVCTSLDGTLGYRYCPTMGKASSLTAVYLNGSAKTIVADPPGAGQVSVTYPIQGGTQITSINFGTATTSSDVVTCDIEGLTVDGTSGGSVILNPVDQLQHFLVNFVFGDWRSGDWLDPATAPIDTASFQLVSTFAAQFAYEGSRKYGGDTKQTRAIETLNDWLQSHPMMRMYWTKAGDLACAVIDHRSPGYLSTPWIIEEQDQMLGSSFKQDHDATQMVSRINASYLWGEHDQKYWSSLAVQDINVPEQTSENMQWVWSSSRYV